MKNMVYKFLGNLVVMVHTAQNPTDEELRAYYDELRTKDVSRTRVLVLTDGGGLNASQRKELNEVLSGRPQPCAVVSDNTMVRGIVTALSWFNRSIKSFSPSDTEEAFKYLGIPTSEFAIVWREIKQLRGQLGLGKDRGMNSYPR